MISLEYDKEWNYLTNQEQELNALWALKNKKLRHVTKHTSPKRKYTIITVICV